MVVVSVRSLRPPEPAPPRRPPSRSRLASNPAWRPPPCRGRPRRLRPTSGTGRSAGLDHRRAGTRLGDGGIVARGLRRMRLEAGAGHGCVRPRSRTTGRLRRRPGARRSASAGTSSGPTRSGPDGPGGEGQRTFDGERSKRSRTETMAALGPTGPQYRSAAASRLPGTETVLASSFEVVWLESTFHDSFSGRVSCTSGFLRVGSAHTSNTRRGVCNARTRPESAYRWRAGGTSRSDPTGHQSTKMRLRRHAGQNTRLRRRGGATN